MATETVQRSNEGHIKQLAAQFRSDSTAFAHWAEGYGVIRHSDTTQVQVYEIADQLLRWNTVQNKDEVFRILAATDRLTSAAMWLVVHMTYAEHVHPDGRDLRAKDFKQKPEGHTGGSLNMVPAYAGYLAANALTRFTRSWLMGQGHCVSAIDAMNLLIGNMNPAHAERYDTSEAGLSRFVQDFYSYAISADGKPQSPLGSHVNTNTAGGIMEGGYLGFAELQYPHMPLPGERLVAFLSDGAFEEQRGSDWAPRWWRAEDSGLVTPIMIMNGRRIDQRSSMAMKGGAQWFEQHLRLNNFTPLIIDGRDPASFAWAIIEMETRLMEAAENVNRGDSHYPVPLYYGIANTEKGFGFPGAGTNRAHNLPLRGNPATDSDARKEFNEGARALWVDHRDLDKAIRVLNQHDSQNRPRERDHALARRNVKTPQLPEPLWQDTSEQQGHSTVVSAMEGIDRYFCQIIDANPQLRVRVGNPDEMRSNKLDGTLDRLKHRVTNPEPGIAEAIDGQVITALNEEAVVNAALANKGGINLVATYEAFGVKMLGAIRQELIFARHQREDGNLPGWLSVPVILTSHTWENGKNEQSHQDPTCCEALMNEMTDVSRVIFPADWNSAIAALQHTYATHGQIHTLVIPKRPLPVHFTPEQAQQLANHGAVRLRGTGNASEELLIVATGGYQLQEALKASTRLEYTGVEHAVIYLQEPGKFRIPRDAQEKEHLASPEIIEALFPSTADVRVFLTHTHPEPYAGTIWPLITDPTLNPVLGYTNHGGTLDEKGMLFANGCTWAHAVADAAIALGDQPEMLLNQDEFGAISGISDACAVLDPDLQQLEES
ncbi:MAG: xylulose 5-phosphate 3-epimerase [Gammaproteobacteria bacterium]|jgi:phosphoketolase